jgi:hypothetical protein
MGKPVAFSVAEEAPQTIPVAFICLEKVDDNNNLSGFAAELKQPQLSHLWLELARLRVKAHAYSGIELGEVLHAE